VREWRRPELVVLVRATAEESVLTVCKGHPPQTAWITHHDACHSDSDCVTLCSGITTS